MSPDSKSEEHQIEDIRTNVLYDTLDGFKKNSVICKPMRQICEFREDYSIESNFVANLW